MSRSLTRGLADPKKQHEIFSGTNIEEETLTSSLSSHSQVMVTKGFSLSLMKETYLISETPSDKISFMVQFLLAFLNIYEQFKNDDYTKYQTVLLT